MGYMDNLAQKYTFPVAYWDEKSTKVQFEIFTDEPTRSSITACMVFAYHDDTLLLAKPVRGWGLPGGHIEEGESAQECATREVFEETAVDIKNLQLIGGWKTTKLVENEGNAKYPSTGYQLLYIAEVDTIHPFTPQHESSERKFLTVSDIKKNHHKYEPVIEVLAYADECIQAAT